VAENLYCTSGESLFHEMTGSSKSQNVLTPGYDNYRKLVYKTSALKLIVDLYLGLAFDGLPV
jgi:hypothetical protein